MSKMALVYRGDGSTSRRRARLPPQAAVCILIIPFSPVSRS